MNKTWTTGKWNEIKGKVRQQWSELTEDDVAKVKGQREELLGLIQQRCDKEPKTAEKELSKWETEVGLS